MVNSKAILSGNIIGRLSQTQGLIRYLILKKVNMSSSSGKRTGGPKNCAILKIDLMWTSVIFTVVREDNLVWEYFKKARLMFSINIPKYWHVKTKTPVIENGYVTQNMVFQRYTSVCLLECGSIRIKKFLKTKM